MIQRIQSIYLLLVAVIAFLVIFLNPNYARFDKNGEATYAELRYTSTHLYKGSEPPVSVSKWINVLVIGGLFVGSLFAIFLFKKQELQKKLAIYLALLSALLLLIMVLDYNTMSQQYKDNVNYPGIWSVLPLISVVLCFMAWRGIRKDESLLKSMDRIR